MKSVSFSCVATLTETPEEIAEQILDVSNWTDFQGYGPLPGIVSAEFEVRTPEVVGSRVRVRNSDGSSHIEEIVSWDPASKIELRMAEFSAPLSRLATGIDEIWSFTRRDETTVVERSFALHARSFWTRPMLVVISMLLRRAIDRHLLQMRREA